MTRSRTKYIDAVEPHSIQIRIGNVGTPFHAIDLKIHTASDAFQEESEMDRNVKDRVTKMRWSMESDDEEQPAEDAKDSGSSKDASSEETEVCCLNFKLNDHRVLKRKTKASKNEIVNLKTLMMKTCGKGS